MTLAELLNAQQIAGANYQRAVNELYDAYVVLAATDAALANSNVNPNHSDVRSFASPAADLRPFDHPVYAPLKLPCDWRETIASRRDTLIGAIAN